MIKKLEIISGLTLIMPRWNIIVKEKVTTILYPGTLLGYVAKKNGKLIFRFKRLPRKMKKQIKNRYKYL